MKYLTAFLALILGACVSVEQKKAVLQDKQNIEKFNELKSKVQIFDGCDKLGMLYDFQWLDAPTVEDLAKIMPIFALKSQDATDIDKVYNIDFSVIKKYKCDDKDNVAQLIAEVNEYCDAKYTINAYEQQYCKQYLNDAIVNNEKYRNKQTMQNLISRYNSDYVIDYTQNNLEYAIKKNIEQIYPLPDESEFFLQEFKPSELLKARDKTVGVYDNYCESFLCRYQSNVVTELDSIRVLYDICLQLFLLPNDIEKQKCACYTHNAYKNMSYKNIIYIYEQREIPQSKMPELKKIFRQCEQKISKRQINRYGETNENAVHTRF